MLNTVITGAGALILRTTAGRAADQTLKGDAAIGDWRDDNLGVKRLLSLKD